MGWFIGTIVIAILCCLGTAGYGYELYQTINHCRHKHYHQIFENLMWFGCSAFCTVAAGNMVYMLWITRATW